MNFHFHLWGAWRIPLGIHNWLTNLLKVTILLDKSYNFWIELMKARITIIPNKHVSQTKIENRTEKYQVLLPNDLRFTWKWTKNTTQMYGRWKTYTLFSWCSPTVHLLSFSCALSMFRCFLQSRFPFPMKTHFSVKNSISICDFHQRTFCKKKWENRVTHQNLFYVTNNDTTVAPIKNNTHDNVNGKTTEFSTIRRK